jgi:hypothetical protein
LKCCHDDESTTNQISRTIRPISTWDTWKSFPIPVKRIPDATVPIGTDLDLRQACCDPTYHHEIVIILVSHIIAVVVEIIQHNTTEFPTHNWWSILTIISTVVPMHVLEVLKKE